MDPTSLASIIEDDESKVESFRSQEIEFKSKANSNHPPFLSSEEILQHLKECNREKEVVDGITTTILTNRENRAARERLRLQRYLSKLSDQQILHLFTYDLLNNSTEEYILSLAKSLPEWSQDMKICIFCFDVFDANRNLPFTKTTTGGYTKVIKGNCPGIEHEWEITKINNLENHYLEGGAIKERPYIVYLAQHCVRCGYTVSQDLCAANNNLGIYGDATHCQIGVHASEWPTQWKH